MHYYVKITAIIPILEIWKGPFLTAEEAWEWVDHHNDPLVDYDVINVDDPEPKG